jgi:hypothetical protein
MLIFHVLIAVIGIFHAVVTALFPSETKLRVSAVLSGCTLVSGMMLLITASTGFSAVCVRGILFLGIIGMCSYIAKRKLSRALLY